MLPPRGNALRSGNPLQQRTRPPAHTRDGEGLRRPPLMRLPIWKLPFRLRPHSGRLEANLEKQSRHSHQMMEAGVRIPSRPHLPSKPLYTGLRGHLATRPSLARRDKRQASPDATRTELARLTAAPNAERHGRGKSVPPCPKGSLCSGSCGFPCSGSGVTRIPAFAPCGRRYAESSDILHRLTRISRKRGFDPEENKD